MYAKETDLCADFISRLPDKWIAYPETGGFDILLVRKIDGYQIGIEAKLKLNAKVITQIADSYSHYHEISPAPDSRGILIPYVGGGDFAKVCDLLGIGIIRIAPEDHPEYGCYSSWRNLGLPDAWTDNYGKYHSKSWFDFCPAQRIRLPEYMPDVICGDKSPVQLTDWKIRAIKLSVLHDKIGFATRQDFKDLEISSSRFIQGGMTAWMVQGGERGKWVKSSRFPDFSAQHPVNYKQIEADFDVWNPRKGETK